MNILSSIGVGNSISLKDWTYLNEAAKSGRGNSIFVSDEEDFSGKVVELLDKTLTPCLHSF